MKRSVERMVKTVRGTEPEVFIGFQQIECLHSPHAGVGASETPLFVQSVWILVLLALASVAAAFEFLLDPNA
jgi:hypothetical protein